MSVTEGGIVASKGVLPNLGGDVTRDAILQYARAVSPRYLAAAKREKGVILDEFCKTTGHHRKSAIRLLCRPPKLARTGLGRPRQYALPALEALRRVWEASDRLCSKRLAPFLSELVPLLERHGALDLPAQVRQQLLQMSPSTMDRLLRPYRAYGLRRPYTTRKSPGQLKAAIPIRTFGEWAQAKPGSMQMDLVAHCGQSTEGFYLNTLVAVDVATSWSEFEVIWGKGQQRVGTAVHKVRQRLPFRLQEIHTDNGSEFINDLLYPWCQREGIRLTRGRSYKKNDQAYVEQKNWSVPRKLIGYDRYCSKAAYEQMQRLYELVRLYVNFFQPVSKLVSKEREGAKVKKRYDVAQTPYQRLLASQVLELAQAQSLARLYARLNPIQLRAEIEEGLEALWKLADRGRAGKPTTEAEAELVALP
jgi:transposase InsO family protein